MSEVMTYSIVPFAISWVEMCIYAIRYTGESRPLYSNMIQRTLVPATVIAVPTDNKGKILTRLGTLITTFLNSIACSS